ncbi:flagellar brake protein [Bacillus sp. 1P06AnD]|uniref:flagellar brake protein n=1 Tax=Bacillus sp. 1P06AnD TaxID=3132208 RepID=UPI0039A1A5B3
MKIGNRLVLESKGSGSYEKYQSKILEMSNGCVYIDYPQNMATKKTAFLPDGITLKASYVDETENAFWFQTEVLGKRKSTIPMIQLSLPPKETHNKIQRREFVRIETNIDAAVHSPNHAFPPFTTVTEDISAGGAAILVPKEIKVEENSRATIWLVLPAKGGSIHYVKVDSQVVRLIEQPAGRYNVMTMQFNEIPDKERQQLIRFCFEKQLEQRKVRD